jgi:hypothetical protein
VLLTVTVNGIPELPGTTFTGLITQFVGAPAPQVRTTELLYPFTAVIVPSKTVLVFTRAERLGLLMAKV